MSNIPSGIVTFLFTDIEESTKLAQENNNSYIDALSKHHEILYEVIDSNNGFVFKIIGDAFCCAFSNAADAVKAAVDVQVKLNSIEWKDSVIKVRMGIHTGDSEWSGKDYMGYITLARAQRIMSAAYGEQIIISNNTYELVREKITSEISFRDLGERRLKDVILPIRLFQIVSKGLREDFPPLKALDARPNNLPIQLTSFIGREEEIKQIKSLLKPTRLLTLTGPGGSGKTRLSLQIAADTIDDFANGVWFVDLAFLIDPIFLPQVIAKVLGVQEQPKVELEDTLFDYLREKEILIILDNCEHIVGACANLTEKLLSKIPKLKIIATSREALRCSGEQTHRILSLKIPDPKKEISPEQLSQFESVRLFIERAISVSPSFRVNEANSHALAGICHQLEGIPLAIELAAARIKILSVEKIYQKLDDRFKLLTGGKRTALPRQQTLKALIDWSYDLLSEQEKILWRRLSVFSGGWTLEAAEVICSNNVISEAEVINLLDNLVEKSIIIFDEENERYRILETLKQYGEEKLREANEAEKIFSEHLHYFVQISESAKPKLKGSEMQIWLEKLEADHNNLRSAIEWSIRDGDKEEGARLAGALGYFWNMRGDYSTGRRMLESILSNAQGVSKISRAKLLNSLGSIVMFLGEYESAQKSFEESLSLRRDMEDKSGIADSLNSLGTVAYAQGNYEQAEKFSEESLILRRETGEKHSIANSLNILGNIALDRGNYEQAQKFLEESLALQREMGDRRGVAYSLATMGSLAFTQENYEQAQKLIEESLSLSREIKDKRLMAYSLNSLGNLIYNQKNYEHAEKFYEESLILRREIGEKSGIAESLLGFCGILIAGNHLSRAAILLGAVEAALKSIGRVLERAEQKLQEQIVNKLHEKLNDEEFSKYLEEGRKLTLEQAAELALSVSS